MSRRTTKRSAPPNPRLQRILLRQGYGAQARFALLRSPLSRKPLGLLRKMQTRLGLLIAATLIAEALWAVEGSREFAGSYYQGDGTGVNWYLHLHGDGTFAFRWDGCLGTYDEKSGGWNVLPDGTIELVIRSQKTDPVGRSIPLALRPIRWGNRLYLVDSSALLDFCNLVNSGSEPRHEAHGLAFLRDDDWDRAVAGTPDVPNSWRSFLLAAPVRGQITKVLGKKNAEIDRGGDHGLKRGMEVYWQGPDFLPYRVVSTTSRTAIIETAYDDVTKRTGPVSTLLYDETLQPQHNR